MNSRNTPYFQLINDQLSWCPNLTKHLEKFNVNANTNNYKVVAIIGAQGTGKSTLLNSLFDTRFQVMNSQKSRSQTTRGIFVQPTPGKPIADTFLVFDVEGTDSGEREDYGTKFEKMLCTFALAVSDVLLVNMFTNEIGRRTGSSMPLLKTILKINVQLFKHEIRPKKVLIILRDFGDNENVDEINRKFKVYLQSALDEIKTATRVSLQDVIQYQLVMMPHFDYQRDDFNRTAKEIQRKLSEKNVFPRGNPSLPMNGLEKYLENIWRKIKSDETLDIPSEQFLVSNYLCDKAFDSSLAAIENDMNFLRTDCTRRLLGGEFLKFYNMLKNKALEKFRQITMYLEKSVTQPAEVELVDAINLQFQEFSSNQIDLLIKSIEKDVEMEMKSRQNFQTVDQLLDQAKRIKKVFVDKFENDIRLYKLKGEPASEREKMQMLGRISELQASQIDKCIRELENKKRIEDQMKEEQRKRENEEYQRMINKRNQWNVEYDSDYGGIQTRPHFDSVLHYPDPLVRKLCSIVEEKSPPKHKDYPIFIPKIDVKPPQITGPKKKDGTLDMRFTVNRESKKIEGHQYNVNGTLDKRWSNNNGPLKKDGTPDMRYKVNWGLK